MECPPIPNPPSTVEEDISLKPSTNTDTSKDLSKEVLELNYDDKKRVASPFNTPLGGRLEDDDDGLISTNKEGDENVKMKITLRVHQPLMLRTMPLGPD